MAEFRRELELNPDNADAGAMLALLLVRAKICPARCHTPGRRPRTKPADALAEYAYGEVLLGTGDLRPAIARLEAAERLDPAALNTTLPWRARIPVPAALRTRAGNGACRWIWRRESHTPNSMRRAPRVARALRRTDDYRWIAKAGHWWLAAVCVALAGAALGASPQPAKATCANCHRAEAQSQPHTPMGIGIELPPNQEALEAHPKLTVEENGYRYNIERKNGVSTYTVSDGSGTLSLPIRYAFGVHN
jgi:tetratricopeptide (TPR) repeat protein